MFWLGPFEYKSKKELLDRLKVYLQKAPAGMTNNKFAVKKLHLLLAMHPDADRKIGVGIDHFRIERNALGAGRGSGSSAWMAVKIPFLQTVHHWRRSISPWQGMRGIEVCSRPQLIAFRDSLGLPVTCAASGVIITQRKDLHLDHREPFWMLLERLCQDRNVDLTKLETFGNGEKLALVDQTISSAFAQYHRLRAELQPLLKAANVAKGGVMSVGLKVRKKKSIHGEGRRV